MCICISTIMGPCPNTNHDEVTIEDTIGIGIKSSLEKKKEVSSLCEERASPVQSYEVSIRDSIQSLERVRAALKHQEQELLAILASIDNHLSFAPSFFWRLNCRFCSFICGQRKDNNNMQHENIVLDLELATEPNARP